MSHDKNLINQIKYKSVKNNPSVRASQEIPYTALPVLPAITENTVFSVVESTINYQTTFSEITSTISTNNKVVASEQIRITEEIVNSFGATQKLGLTKITKKITISPSVQNTELDSSDLAGYVDIYIEFDNGNFQFQEYNIIIAASDNKRYRVTYQNIFDGGLFSFVKFNIYRTSLSPDFFLASFLMLKNGDSNNSIDGTYINSLLNNYYDKTIDFRIKKTGTAFNGTDYVVFQKGILGIDFVDSSNTNNYSNNFVLTSPQGVGSVIIDEATTKQKYKLIFVFDTASFIKSNAIQNISSTITNYEVLTNDNQSFFTSTDVTQKENEIQCIYIKDPSQTNPNPKIKIYNTSVDGIEYSGVEIANYTLTDALKLKSTITGSGVFLVALVAHGDDF